MAADPREIIVRNLFLIQRLGNGLSDDAQELIRAAFDEIVGEMAKLDPTAVQLRYRKRRTETLVARIEEILGPAFSEVYKQQRAALAAVGAQQAQTATLHLRAVLGAGNAGKVAPTTGLGPNFFKAVIDTDPMQGHLLKSWFENEAAGTAFRAAQQIRLGVAQGETIGQLVQRVRGKATGAPIRDAKGRITGYRFSGGVMETTTRHAEAIVRTAVNEISNTAALNTFRANSDITSEYQYTATLDSRTSLVCASLDGRRFKYDDPQAKRPPQHINCRSIVVPVVDWAGLGLEPPPEGTRASAGGQVSADTQYSDWLKGQSATVQDEILGPSRGRLFRDGKVTLREMVRSDGRRVRLEELSAAA
jgi:SPP1 gp7 family putative phage head morphogenesis protein